MISSHMIIETFYEQYTRSKEMALEAIARKQNVVLYGKGSNGKTYLTNELTLEKHLDMTAYRVIPIEYEDRKQDTHTLDRKYWIECRHMEYALQKLHNESFVVINMNQFQHPNASASASASASANTNKREYTPLYEGNVIDAYGHC